MAIGLLKGGECFCATIDEFSKMKHVIAKECYLSCPFSTFLPQLPPIFPPSEGCGGDRGYSVYCQPTTEQVQCPTPPPTLSSKAEGEGNKSGDVFLGIKKLEGCAKCPSTSNCKEIAISPSYDYFPTLEPSHCIAFCEGNVKYSVTSGGSPGESIHLEKIRLPTRYSLLMWDRSIFGLPVPICRCTDNLQPFSILPQEEGQEACNTACPGDENEMCGNDGKSGDVFASVYCNFEDCLDPKTTTSSLTTTTMVTGDESSECSQSTTQTPTTTLSSSYSTTTSPLPCEVKCVGRELNGREWEVCGGGVMSKDCGGISERIAEGEATWECSLDGHFVTEQPIYSQCHSQWVEDLVKQSEQVNDTVSHIIFLLMSINE
jgi:hypothetical protein